MEKEIADIIKSFMPDYGTETQQAIVDDAINEAAVDLAALFEREMAEMTDALEVYANEDMWTFETSRCWKRRYNVFKPCDQHGYELAQKALAETSKKGELPEKRPEIEKAKESAE